MARISRLSDAFAHAVEEALENVSDLTWLGNESPLAAPYFLGERMSAGPGAETPAGRGEVLRRLLREGASQLDPDHQRLLTTSYFERDPNLNSVGLAFQLNLAEKTFFRHRTAAIEALADRLSQIVLSPMRLEAPRARPIMGRQGVIAEALPALREGYTVALSGVSGIGKTALGAFLASQWPGRAVFWFTLRPGLTDQLSSFVFALGFFLRRLGASSAWRQLVADRGAVQITQMMGLLRNDLEALGAREALLCVDEADLLKQDWTEHARLIHVLDDLRGISPMLLMGHQLNLQAVQHYALAGLTPEVVADWLQKESVAGVSPSDQQSLCRASRGNPALIRLCLILYRMGESMKDVIAHMGMAPSVEAIFNRIWRRLDEAEQMMLMRLAVFRSAAPADAWPEQDQQLALQALIERGVVQAGERGEVSVLSYLREAAYRLIPAELKTSLHLSAAQIRETRAEYTPAAYHYLAGRKPALAVWVWFNHRQSEIERGHGPAALAMFNDISPAELKDDEDRRALAIVRAELFKLTGASEQAMAAIESAPWPAGHPATSYAHQLQGDFLEMQGQLNQALAHYRHAYQAVLAQPERQLVQLRKSMGYIYLFRMREMAPARREGALALWHAEIFMGNIEEESGNYPIAHQHYTAALALAAGVENPLLAQSRTLEHLGRLEWSQDDLEHAIPHLEQAIAYAREIGDSLGVAYNQINLSGALIRVKDYQRSLEQAEAGLAIAEALNHAYLTAVLALNAGNASIYLGRLEPAEAFALRSLSAEEITFRPHAIALIGRVRLAQKRYADAESLLHEAVQITEEIQDKDLEPFLWCTLGTTYAEQSKMDEARQAFERARRLYAELGIHTRAAEVEQLIADLAEH